MSASAQRRSDEFLQIAHQFKLGGLVTESSHPVTERLSDVAQQDVGAALRLLFKVDEDVVRKYREVAASGRLETIAADVLSALQAGGRLFFTGCGSTGRLSILLDSIWREFWQQQSAGLGDGPRAARDWENRTFSVMAGGDFALIKAVEGFEDYAAFGRRQMRDLGVRAGDIVFAITEGGETSFVIGTAWEGLESGATVYFVYNNPDDVLCRHVERSREVIEEPRIRKLNLTTGPMAIGGSTRMQATTIQLCVLVTVLEMVLRQLQTPDSPDAAQAVRGVPQQFLAGIESLHPTLLSDVVLDGLAALVQAEEAAYRSGGRANYQADRLAIDVLTDTTERSPTFSTPAFRKAGDAVASESWSFLFLPHRSTDHAWLWLLKRKPRCIEWTDTDIRSLAPPERCDRIREVVNAIREPELLKFAIGGDGMAARPLRSTDYCLRVVALPESLTLSPEPASRSRPEALSEGRENGSLLTSAPAEGGARPSSGMLCFVGEAQSGHGKEPVSSAVDRRRAVVIEVPAKGFLTDGLLRVAVKMVLNALSTCVMVRLGRVMGNTMIYVVPSNLKLIDRATRYIAQLTQLDYAKANRLLFETIEYVEPRMKVGQAYPPVVGLAVWRAREGVSFAEAEARLGDRSARA